MIKKNQNNTKEYDKRKSRISSKIHVICISSNNVRHHVAKTFTTLRSTSLHLSTLHYFPFKLHPTTLEPSGSRNPPRGGFLALDVRTDGPHSLSRRQTRAQMGFDKGRDPAGRLVSNKHTCIQSERIKVQVDVFYKRNTLKPNKI